MIPMVRGGKLLFLSTCTVKEIDPQTLNSGVPFSQICQRGLCGRIIAYFRVVALQVNEPC